MSFVFASISMAHAEYVDLPIGGGPVLPEPSPSPTVSLPVIGGPVIQPVTPITPQFHDFYNPTPASTPAPSPQFTPLTAPSVVPTAVPVVAPSVTPSVTPSLISAVSSATVPAVGTPLLPPITLSIFGGGDFVSLTEINQLVGTTLFQSLAYYGLELRYPVSLEFSLLLRAERMSAGSSVGAASFSLSSLPVTVGIDYLLLRERKLRMHLSILAGPALNTQLTETASSLPSPNVTQFSSTGVSSMIRFGLEVPLTRRIGLFGEGGYRYLNTSSMLPSQTGSGGTIFQSSGQYQSVPLNLSGPFIGAGFVFAL
jgi:hypothetical protein